MVFGDRRTDGRTHPPSPPAAKSPPPRWPPPPSSPAARRLLPAAARAALAAAAEDDDQPEVERGREGEKERPEGSPTSAASIPLLHPPFRASELDEREYSLMTSSRRRGGSQNRRTCSGENLLSNFLQTSYANVPNEKKDEEEQEEEEESQEMRQDDLMRPGKRRRRTVASDQTVVQHRRRRIHSSFDSKEGNICHQMCLHIGIQRSNLQWPQDRERMMHNPSEKTTSMLSRQ